MSRAALGYLLVAGSFLVMGLVGEHEEEGATSLEPAP